MSVRRSWDLIGSSMSDAILEICVDDAAGLAAAIEGGADRIELCAALSVGGLTPSRGLMALAAGSPVPVYAMIRPRAGDFVFSGREVDIMCVDIEAAREAGLAGVVIGASLSDGSLDREILRCLVDHASGLGLTLHRAFDLVPDFRVATETAIDLGFERILTSGGTPRAVDGFDALGEIIANANGRIAVMPGSGVTAENAHQFIAIGARELHASAGVEIVPGEGKLAELGYVTAGMKRTDAARVAGLKAAIAGRR